MKEVIFSDRLWIPKEAWKSIPKEKRKEQIDKFLKVLVAPKEYCDLLVANRTCYQFDDVFQEQGIKEAEELCKECPNGQLRMSCCFKNENYVSFYRGDLKKIDSLISLVKKYNKGIEIEDKRVIAPIKKKIKLVDTGDDRSKTQNKLAKEIANIGYGIMIAPARFGKTRTSLVIFSLLKQRTFIIAHQKELLEQFYSNWLKFSNLKESDIKINPSIKEAKKLAVSLFTPQHFMGENGKERIKELSKVPGLLLVDEAHRAASSVYNKIINKFHARYRIGMTADASRKDKLHFRIYNTFGPVTATGGVESLTCKYHILNTEVLLPDYDRVPHRRRFAFLNKQMVKSEERNLLIAKRAVRNVEKGHKVLIPLKSIQHVKLIAELIRKKMHSVGIYNPKICEYSAQLVKGAKREEVSQKIRDGYYDVVIAIESMINVGFDAPRISNVILNAGSYSFNIQNRYQLFSRIRTRCAGKKTPLIDILHDECKWSGFSLKSIIKQMQEYDFVEVKKKEK